MDTDSHLLHRYHRQGDSLAFQQLVETHAGMVHATASRVTRDAALAQDVSQETFLALARGSSAAIQSVGGWLHHVAWQKACDRVRGESRRHKYEAAAAEHLHQPPEEPTWAELEPLLDEALEELPAPARELLIERFLVGRTQQELANRAGLSQSTVSRLLNNAIGDLRAILKSKGVASGSGLAVLLSARGIEAAPPALMASLGKLSLSSVGVASSTLTLATILMKTLASKIAIAAAALLLFGTAAYDLGSSEPWLLSFFRKPAPVEPTPPAAVAKTSTADKAPVVAAAAKRPPPPVASFTTLPKSGAKNSDSPEVRLTKLAQITKAANFKALVLKLFSSGDPKHMASELKRLMGIDFSERDLSYAAKSPTTLEVAILSNLALKHPREALAWMAMLDGNDRLMADVVYRQIFKGHPEITAESLAATLPVGPNRDQVLSILRSQQDPVTEAQKALSIRDPRQRIDGLWKLANTWPKERSDDAVKWALENLSGYDLEVFLPRVAHYISSASPDAALGLMNQITDPKLLRLTLVESLYGLVHDSPRMADVVSVIGRLQGADRATAISELTRKWVREDQEGLIEWVNSLESAADFEAALPMALPQLTPENYTKAINSLMSQLDGTLDAALIKAATPDFSGATNTTVDIIHRLTHLPQYSTIGSGQQGNQDLLWQAINKVAAGWVTRQGAQAPQGAQWIDSLTFRTPADKAAVAGQLYNQWKVSDPAAAAAWATAAGVKVP
ncbi:MAG: sigma-70 family RNA polymerase sigma factor [Prosthecobacter sp.]|nr:sigma-70 family RNA polymerase sigma factor [Prosthecobacter sp.]